MKTKKSNNAKSNIFNINKTVKSSITAALITSFTQLHEDNRYKKDKTKIRFIEAYKMNKAAKLSSFIFSKQGVLE